MGMAGLALAEQTVIWILAVCLGLCLTAFAVGTAWFLLQWRKMDRILDSFQRSSPDGERRDMPADVDIQETRESRIVSQLRRIVTDARFREKQAVGEKDHPAIGGDEARRREFLLHVKSQADKVQWLMASLLKASRLENGMIRFPVEAAGIKETIARSLGHVYGQAAAKDIALAVEEFQDFNLIHNPKWTAEALANILENAIKYSPRHSRIHVSVTRLDLYTEITIADEGIGISEKEYNMIFKRFYRSGMVEQQEGSGLGLYLAQLIVLQEKGYITVASRVGQGSRFSMFLLNA